MSLVTLSLNVTATGINDVFVGFGAVEASDSVGARRQGFFATMST